MGDNNDKLPSKDDNDKKLPSSPIRSIPIEISDKNNSNRDRTLSGGAPPSPGQIGMYIGGAGTAASPPSFISLEQLVDTAKNLENMKLAHEIVVDNDFKLTEYEPPENSIEKQVSDVVHRAFWDSLREGLSQSPPDHTNVVQLIGEVKEMIISLLLPNHNRLRNTINESLDIDLIKQKLEVEALDLKVYASFCVDVLGKLCAPVRDDAVNALKAINDPIQLFQDLIQVIKLMKMDMANFTIQQLRPLIQQNSVQYERNKFKEFIETQKEANVDGLQFTKKWLENAVEYCNSTDGLKDNMSPQTVLNSAYTLLLQWDPESPFPETLVMDQSRLLDMGTTCLEIILCAASMAIFLNSFGPQTDQYKNAMFPELKDTVNANVRHSNKKMPEISEDLAGFLKAKITSSNQVIPSNSIESMETQVKALCSPNSEVFSVLRQRLFNFLLSLLSTQSPNSSGIQLPQGFNLCKKEVAQVAGQFVRVISHNRSVFADFYSEILNKLLSMGPPITPRKDT